MIEIGIKNNANLKVYINDIPNLKNIPKDVTECLVEFLVDEIL